MYYLQSRYYDPAIGRFINADGYATINVCSFLCCNMYAYCENDPINCVDYSGTFAWTTVASGVIGAINGAVSCYAVGGSSKEIAVSAILGAINSVANSSLLVKGAIFAYTAITTYIATDNISKAFGAGTVAVIGSYISAEALLGNIGAFATNAFDLSFGLGGSLCTAGIIENYTGINKLSRIKYDPKDQYFKESRIPTPQNNASSIVKPNYNKNNKNDLRRTA